MSIRLGYKASAEQFTARQLVDLTVRAEQLGFDSATISDHFQPWRHTGGHAPFSLAWMAAAGERTERILLGTSVLTPTFRYNPAVIAQAFATMGTMFPGRVMLGLGTGEALNEIATGFRGAGEQEWPEFRERFARLREAVRLMRALWTDERVSFRGEYYSTQDATIYDRPEQEVPIYIGASGPAATRLAGRMADGWITTSGKADELYTDKLIPAFDEGIAKAGRDRADVDRMLEVKVSLRPDRAKAMENTRFWAPLALKPEEKMGVEDPMEMQRLAEELPTERAASRFIVSDDPDEHIQQIQRYIDLGFNHLVFHDPGHDQADFLELYGREVLPKLRAAVA